MSTNDPRYYVITDLPSGDLGPFSWNGLQIEVQAGRVRRDARVRSGLGTSYGTVQDVLSREASSDRQPAARARRVAVETSPTAPAPTGIPWIPLAALALVVVVGGTAWWVQGSPAEPVSAAPPAVLLDVSPTSSQGEDLLRESDFSRPLAQVTQAWRLEVGDRGLVEQTTAGGVSFLHFAATNGDAILNQVVTPPEGGRLRIDYQVRVTQVTEGQHWWNTARLCVLWKDDPNNQHQAFINFTPESRWQTGSLDVQRPPGLTQAVVWVGLASCSGSMDVAYLRMVRVP